MNDFQVAAFAEDFKQLCLKHQAKACFVLVKYQDSKGSMLATGGATDLNAWVDAALYPSTVEYKEPRQ